MSGLRNTYGLRNAFGFRVLSTQRVPAECKAGYPAKLGDSWTYLSTAPRGYPVITT